MGEADVVSGRRGTSGRRVRRWWVAGGLGALVTALLVAAAWPPSEDATTAPPAPSVAAARATAPSTTRPAAAVTGTPSTAPATTTPPAPPAPPAPPETAPPVPPAPVPPPTAPPRAPIRLLVTGDSLGFTAAFPPPARWELPGYVASVSPAAMIGCGVLAATGHGAIDEAGEGAGTFDCSGQARAELEGLADRPDWMVVFSGAWEHLAWRTPDGRVLPARSPELRAALLYELVRRASGAAVVGTRTAFVAWVCPHGVPPTRTGDYSHWYNAILREAAAAVPGAFVVEPTDRVCVGADAGGVPTAEKMAAFRDHHPTDRAWLWKEWLGPSINGRS